MHTKIESISCSALFAFLTLASSSAPGGSEDLLQNKGRSLIR